MSTKTERSQKFPDKRSIRLNQEFFFAEGGVFHLFLVFFKKIKRKEDYGHI